MDLTAKEKTLDSLSRKTYPISFYDMDENSLKKEIYSVFENIFSEYSCEIIQLVIISKEKDSIININKSSNLKTIDEIKGLFSDINFTFESYAFKKENRQEYSIYSENGIEFIFIQYESIDSEIIEKLLEAIWYNLFEYA